MISCVELGELERGKAVGMSQDQAVALHRTGFVKVRRGPHGGPDEWLVDGNEKIGAVRIGDLQVIVKPKTTIRQLLFLLGYAQNPLGWRDETVELAVVEDLVPAFAQILWRQVARALRLGLLQGYKTVETTSTVVRGRIRETAQSYRWHGRALPLEIRYDEFTIDTDENRILRTAIDRMLQVPRVDPESRRQLLHLRSRLAEVATLPFGSPVPRWCATRLNTRYHTALRVAEVVLRATSIDLDQGLVGVNGFVLNAWKVYQDFVTVALKEALLPFGGRTEIEPKGLCLDKAGRLSIKPDLVWYVDDRPAAVVDAKYKLEPKNADAYQMLIYCIGTGLQSGHLVYAAGDSGAVRHEIEKATVEISCHPLPLDVAPDEILERIRMLAQCIVEDASRAHPLHRSLRLLS